MNIARGCLMKSYSKGELFRRDERNKLAFRPSPEGNRPAPEVNHQPLRKQLLTQILEEIRGFLGGERSEQPFRHGGQIRFPLLLNPGSFDSVLDETRIAQCDFVPATGDDKSRQFFFAPESDRDCLELRRDDFRGKLNLFEDLRPIVFAIDGREFRTKGAARPV